MTSRAATLKSVDGSLGTPYLSVHWLLLLGYTVLGKYFAYINVAGIYVGEIVLALGTLAFLSMLSTFKRILIAPTWWLLAFMAWGAIRTIPYLSDYGSLALRDAVIWGYGFFAIILATYLMHRPSLLTTLLPRYRQLIRIALVVVPVVWIVTTGTGWYSVIVDERAHLVLKGSDITTLLSGITAFLLLSPSASALLAFMPFLLAFNVNTRGGLLTSLLSLCLLMYFRPLNKRWLLFLVPALVALSLFIFLDLHVSLPGTPRDISVDTLWYSATSILLPSEHPLYESSRQWRLRWWNSIVSYTFRGEHFWYGKGFGVNIAYEDGIVASPSDGLRSPHSSHFTVLGRAGVPGLALWVGTQLSWALGCWKCINLAKAGSDGASLFLFRFLFVYWFAFLCNSSFDVFLEGPMAGIWFWSVYGAGLACMAFYNKVGAAGRAAGVPLALLSPAGQLAAPPRRN